jgi:large subunit ribosomal protein L12
MEYVYGAMLLHAAGKDINEENLKKVMKAGGTKADDARVKALVSAIDGVDIDEAISSAAAIAPAAPSAPSAPAEEAKEDKAKEDKKAKEAQDEKTEEEAASGLASLFG